MRLRKKKTTNINGFEKEQNHGGLVIRKFIDFMLFSDIVCVFFLLNIIALHSLELYSFLRLTL